MGFDPRILDKISSQSVIQKIQIERDACSIWIPFWIPSPLNRVTRGKVRDAIRMAKEDKLQFGLIANSLKSKPSYSVCLVNVVVIWPIGRRMTDKDSLFKILLDCLVSSRIIPNDSPKFCQPGQIHYARAAARHDQYGTLVNLSEISNA